MNDFTPKFPRCIDGTYRGQRKPLDHSELEITARRADRLYREKLSDEHRASLLVRYGRLADLDKERGQKSSPGYPLRFSLWLTNLEKIYGIDLTDARPAEPMFFARDAIPDPDYILAHKPVLPRNSVAARMQVGASRNGRAPADIAGGDGEFGPGEDI